MVASEFLRRLSKQLVMKARNLILEFNNFKMISVDAGILLFRVALCLELIVVHGLKKIGIGTAVAEVVPNPLNLPDQFNQLFAISANLIFPVFVLFGYLTRLAILPILAVTLTGYFIIHWNDSPLVRDIPFMYSLAFLLLFVTGPGKYSIDYRLCIKNMPVIN